MGPPHTGARSRHLGSRPSHGTIDTQQKGNNGERSRLLTVLGRINPAAWDAIIPHGPRISRFSAIREASNVAAELNPQPLPPKSELLFASVEVAHDIAFAAVSAEAAGTEGASRLVARAIDDWCDTRRPGMPIPWPSPWPFPWPSEREPRPEWDVGASRVVGALAWRPSPRGCLRARRATRCPRRRSSCWRPVSRSDRALESARGRAGSGHADKDRRVLRRLPGPPVVVAAFVPKAGANDVEPR